MSKKSKKQIAKNIDENMLMNDINRVLNFVDKINELNVGKEEDMSKLENDISDFTKNLENKYKDLLSHKKDVDSKK